MHIYYSHVYALMFIHKTMYTNIYVYIIIITYIYIYIYTYVVCINVSCMFPSGPRFSVLDPQRDADHLPVENVSQGQMSEMLES